MRAYAILDSELDQLSMLNTFSVGAFSLAGAFAGYALDWLRDWRAAETAATADTTGAMGICLALASSAAVFFLVGCYLLWKRRSVTKAIKGQAADI